MKRHLLSGAALCLALCAPARAANAPTYLDETGHRKPAQGFVCVNKDTGALESCGTGGGVVGSPSPNSVTVLGFPDGSDSTQKVTAANGLPVAIVSGGLTLTDYATQTTLEAVRVIMANIQSNTDAVTVIAASGAFANGWDINTGSNADSLCASSASTCAKIPLLKGLYARLEIQTGVGTTTAHAAATALTVARGTAGTLHAYAIGNTANSAASFLQIFDAATTGAVTLGTTAPKLSVPLVANGASNITDLEIPLSAGLVWACTTTETGSTQAASACSTNFVFRPS